MLGIRRSPDSTENDRLREVPSLDGEPNSAWLERAQMTLGVILIGGSNLVDFRVRVAQSHARADLLPSFWSRAGILTGDGAILSVPFTQDAALLPGRNAIVESPIEEYDDPERYPNLAVIQFATDEAAALANARRLAFERSVIDLPSLLLPWLAFVWGAGPARNPLTDGLGVPSAAFVETAYGIARVELTPGLSSGSSCPEAIWQAAKWWGAYYAEAHDLTGSEGSVPEGSFVIRQPAASVIE